MRLKIIHKRADEVLKLSFVFQDKNPEIQYVISNAQVFVAEKGTLLTDTSEEMIEPALHSISGNKLIVAIKKGKAGKTYILSTQARMATGEIFEKVIHLDVLQSYSSGYLFNPKYPYLLTENGYLLITENGNPILVTLGPVTPQIRYAILTENGNALLTENREVLKYA
jgi:hypothetical protein